MSNMGTLARDLYPWLRARLALSLPFTPSGGVTSPFSTSGINPFVAPIAWDMTPRALYCSVFVATTNNGSNYWTMTLNIVTPGGTVTAQGSVDTSAITAGGWNTLTLSSFTTAQWPAATYALASITLTKTGTPGNLYLNPALFVV